MKTRRPSAHPGQETDLEDFRELLGPEIANRYSEGQLRQLQREMYQMAELLLDLYLMRRKLTTRGRRPPAET